MLNLNFSLFHPSQLKSKRKRLFLFASFLLPAVIFFTYFAWQDFNILTVDLGQQYIDFFAFLRQNLLTSPLKFIYSFQNGLGGPMIGTCAYYLLSPFNLLIFCFPVSQLPWALLLIITLKIGSIGLSAYYYWQQKTDSSFALAASLAYSLSAYVIANHFNLMWLDALILLPLLIKSIDQLLTAKKNHLIAITFLLWLSNFYVGLMALFFAFLYFLSRLFLQRPNQRKKDVLAYLKESITGTLLASFILLPALSEIISNKGSSPQLQFTWQFNPLNELAKLAIGSYDFQEMQTGMPNIYFTMPFLLITLLYFTSRRIELKVKLINLGLLLFLILSLFCQPLVLLWHLGQFPIWYPGRFTFVLIFFCLNLAIDFLKNKEKLFWQQKLFALGAAILVISYCYLNQNNFTFLTKNNLLLTLLFMALALLFISFIYPSKLAAGFLLFIVLTETSTNLICCLNNLSYQNKIDYQNFQQNASQITRRMQQKDHGFYRTEKNFYRSDDDSFSANYNGLSSFNSLRSQRSLTFLAQLGYLHSSNSVTNNGGTPISDAILGIKYYLLPNRDSGLNIKKNKKMRYNNFNQRYDLAGSFSASQPQLILLKNKDALPLLFLSPASLQQPLSLASNSPLEAQEEFWQKITGTKASLIRELDWSQTKNKHFLMQKSQTKIADPNFKLKHEFICQLLSQQSADYYLAVPAEFNEENLSLWVNQKKFNLTVRDSQPHLINLGYLTAGQRIKLRLAAKQGSFNLSEFHLWQIKTPLLAKEAQHFKERQPQFNLINPLTIKSQAFTTKTRKNLITTIPYASSWLIFDHHHLLAHRNFARTFIAAPLSKGRHQLTILYFPFAFLAGILLSLLTVLILSLS